MGIGKRRSMVINACATRSIVLSVPALQQRIGGRSTVTTPVRPSRLGRGCRRCQHQASHRRGHGIARATGATGRRLLMENHRGISTVRRGESGSPPHASLQLSIHPASGVVGHTHRSEHRASSRRRSSGSPRRSCFCPSGVLTVPRSSTGGAVHFFAQLYNCELERNSLAIKFCAYVMLGTQAVQKNEPHPSTGVTLWMARGFPPCQ